jgi:hypothetical protein
MNRSSVSQCQAAGQILRSPTCLPAIVEFERLLTTSSSFFARSGKRSVSGHRRSQSPQPQKNRFGKDAGYASSSSAMTAAVYP